MINRRDFVTKGFAGSVGLAVFGLTWPDLLASPKKGIKASEVKIKYLPARATVLVNESHDGSIPLTRGWPPNWKFLGRTTEDTKLSYNNSVDEPLITDLTIQKLDIKVSGVAVNVDKVRELMFIINSHDKSREMHFVSTNARLVRPPQWFRVESDKVFAAPAVTYYIATFNPITRKDGKPYYFDTTLFSSGVYGKTEE